MISLTLSGVRTYPPATPTASPIIPAPRNFRNDLLFSSTTDNSPGIIPLYRIYILIIIKL
jgi:hypothetical protein